MASRFPGLTISAIILRVFYNWPAAFQQRHPRCVSSSGGTPWGVVADAPTTASVRITRSCGPSSVVQVTSLTVTVPETVDVKELESEIVTAVADRLRDDHGYELVAEAGAGGSETRNEHLLHPAGSIVVDSKPGALKGKLHGVKVDAHDLFTGVSSELEQRHEGLRVEIG